MDMKSKIELSCRTAEEFTKIYYKSIDKARHQMQKLYMDDGLLVWNGNNCSGSANIQKFYLDLPPSEHILTTLDAQPILGVAVGEQQTHLVQVSGTVRYQDRLPKSFMQNFVIIAHTEKWKILTDCFRVRESLNGPEKS